MLYRLANPRVTRLMVAVRLTTRIDCRMRGQVEVATTPNGDQHQTQVVKGKHRVVRYGGVVMLWRFLSFLLCCDS